MINRIFDYSKIKLRYNADEIFRMFLREVEGKNLDYKGEYTISEIYDEILYKKKPKLMKDATYRYSFMSMFGGQNGRDYFIFKNESVRRWFTETCNNPKRNNMAWRFEKPNEAVRINPKYVFEGLSVKDETHEKQ